MEQQLFKAGFIQLINKVAEVWSIPDTEMALECFTKDAVYMQPPNIQLFVGHEQLKPYFGALTSGYYLTFHNIWFDENKQLGSAEFSFGVVNNPTNDTGVIIFEIKNSKISFWREYIQNGPSDFNSYISISMHKDWEWHIGNYP